MHIASLTLLLGFFLIVADAAPASIPAALIIQSNTSPHTRYFLKRQAGCDQAKCDQCRKDAKCIAGTPDWLASSHGTQEELDAD